MKFSKLYEELKFDDVFPVASDEEHATRRAQYQEMRFKEAINDAKKTMLPDGTWHIHNDLLVNDCGLTSLKDLNVSIVDGSIDCGYNKLTSLEGAPKEVKNGFYCYYNALTTLKGAPKEVGGDFYCFNNSKEFTIDEVRAVCDVKGDIKVCTKLYEELKFDDVFPVASPAEVAARKEHYQEINIKEILDSVKKTKLPDGTWHIHGDLYVDSCELSTLEVLNVSVVDGNFDCDYNLLNDLKGSPKEIKGYFRCESNNITSLEGAPEKVGRNFSCAYNYLTSLEGAPKEVGGSFFCGQNTSSFTKDDVKAVCNVKGLIHYEILKII